MSGSRRNSVFAIMILGAVLAGPVVAGARLARAKRDADAAQRSLDEAARLADRIEELERLHPWRLDASPPPSDLTPRLLSALDAARLPKDRVRSVRQTSDRAISSEAGPGAQVVRQRTVSVSLEPVSIPEVGAVLAAWRRLEPLWVVSMIELKHTPGADRLGVMRVDLTRTYVQTGTEPKRQGARR